MRINHNIAALNTYRQLQMNNTQQQESLEKLSSGLRINKAADDAAGLAISEKMRGQIRGLEQATRNAQDGISMIQTAEGGLNETHSILQRMRELAVQSSSDSNTETDREEIQKEVEELIGEIDRIADTTEFNTQKLLNGDLKGPQDVSGYVEFDNANDAFDSVEATASGSGAYSDISFNVKITDYDDSSGGGYTIEYSDMDGNNTGELSGVSAGDTVSGIGDYSITLSSGLSGADAIGQEATFTAREGTTDYSDNSLTFQIGANSSQTINVDMGDMSAEGLNVSSLDVTTSQSAEASISAIDKAIEDVSSERAKLGAFQNRLEHTINNLGTSSENITASESRIRDVDYAEAA